MAPSNAFKRDKRVVSNLQLARHSFLSKEIIEMMIYNYLESS